MKGVVEVTKVTGQMVFKLQDQEKAPKKFLRDNKGQGYKLQMNHVVDSITFGHQSQHADIRKFFGEIDNGTHTIFNMFKKDGKVNEDLKNEPEEKAQDYFYFLKLVPHVFVDHIEQQQRYSYSYSLNHNKKDSHGKTSLTIILDYAPINMILSKEWRPVGEFLTNSCSIVGGVFIIFGLVNSFALSIRNKLKGE